MCIKKLRELLLLTIMLVFCGTNGTLTELPEHQVLSSEHQTAVLRCRSDSGHRVGWYALPLYWNHGKERRKAEELWNGYENRTDLPAYLTLYPVGNRNYDLKINHCDDAARTYFCREPGTLMEPSAEVVSIKSHPICNDSSTEDLVNLTCSMEFRGNWAPTMEWSSQGEKVLSVNTTTVPNQRVTSTLVMPVQKGSRHYTCTTKFDISGKPRNTTAANVPGYNRVWTCPAFPKSQDEMTAKVVVTLTIVIALWVAGGLLAAAGIACFIHRRRNRDLA